MVEQLLRSKTLRCRTCCLVRWRGHASVDDSWEPVGLLAPFQEQLADYEAAAAQRPKAVWALRRAAVSSP